MSAAGIAFVCPPKDTMLLARRALWLPTSAGSWAQPGGGIERGEGALHAALREVEEELSIPASWVTKHGRFLGSIVQRRSTPFALFVVAVPARGFPKVRLNDENLDVAWVPLESPKAAQESIGDSASIHAGTRASWDQVRSMCRAVRRTTP